MLDKGENFIKLKCEYQEKTPRRPGSKRSFSRKISFENGDPVAFSIKKPENMDCLGSFVDLVE